VKAEDEKPAEKK
jgi:hypothetical protein